MAKLEFGVADTNAVGAALADIGGAITLNGDFTEIVFDLENDGTALVDFALLVKAHSGADAFQTIISGATWNTVSGNLKEVVGTLNTLADAARGFAHVEVGPVYQIKFQADVNGAAATGTLTLSANTSATETVTIDTTVYTFVSSLSAAYDVLIGATASDTIDNLIAAINKDAGEGTLYGTGTVAHTTVTAAAGAGDTMDVTAITAGLAGNSIATTETSATASWGGATLSGGVGTSVAINGTAR